MVNLSMFRIPTMPSALLASLFQAIGTFAVLFLVIMYLQGVRQLTPLHASLLLVPGYLIGGLFAPFGGRLADRVGPVVAGHGRHPDPDRRPGRLRAARRAQPAT